MSDERWREITAVFNSAVALGPAERSAFLEERCAADSELRREVERLIRSHESAGSLIERPAYERGAALLAAQREDPLVGRTLGGYRLESLLGEGGMGRVYLGRHARLGRRAAVKVLPEGFTKDASLVARFQQEARAASQLNHPNILTVYEIGEDAGTHFIAAEYVEGETLRERLRRGRPDAAEAVEVAAQVAAALAKAHAAGVVHRDIKPENVMVDEDGRARVLDFGIAKLTERRGVAGGTEVPTVLKADTDPGTVLGTAGYMSPEQARALEVDARTDIWSLGVMLYEMLAGRPPFEGETPMDVRAAVIGREPPPLAEAAPGSPPELQWIVSKALSKDRDGRQQTARELLSDLRRVAESLNERAKSERAAPSDSGVTAVSVAGGAAAVGGTQAAERGDATRAAESAHTTSSAEYIVTGIRRHKRAALTAVAALALAVAAVGYVAYRWRASAPEIRSVAVLPFENVGGDPDTEYLSDGVAESLINSLSRLPNLRVMARASSFSYKGRSVDPREAGRALNVDAVLTGRVVQRGDALVVQSDLVRVADGAQLWGERYERRLADMAAVQQEIAREISETMRRRLTGEQRQQVAKRPTEDAAAYELYLKGRHSAGKGTEEGYRQAIEFYRRAVDRDPGFALAYAGVANGYQLLSGVLGFVSPKEVAPQIKDAVERALALDETLDDAHYALATFKLNYEWDWAGAEREFRRTIELNPNHAGAHSGYATLLHMRGQFDEAVAMRERGRQLNPASPFAVANVGYPLYYARRYDQALEQYRKALELDPNFSWTHLWIGQTYVQQGRYDEAIAEIKQAIALSEGNVRDTATLGHAYAVAGRTGDALQVLAELKERARHKYVSPYFIALIYTGLGDKDQAFAWLEKAYEERHPYLILIRVEPVFDGLRSDPRYSELLRRMNLTQ